MIADAGSELGIGLGMGSLIVTSLAIWLMKRAWARISDHVNNGNIHLSVNNGAVKEGICKLRMVNINQTIDAVGVKIDTVEEKVDNVKDNVHWMRHHMCQQLDPKGGTAMGMPTLDD